MRERKSQLTSLFDKIDWLMLEGSHHGVKMLPPDRISVSFRKSKKGLLSPDRVTVRFGREVRELLQWSPGDRIAIFNDPNDLLTFMLVKSEEGTGYKLILETNTTICSVGFKWVYPNMILWDLKAAQVDFECRNKHIVFRVDRNTF